MHTVEKGDLTVAMLIARLLRKRFTVLQPVSELSRYDLVIDRGAGFERVQCKTGYLKSGAVRFNTCSSTLHHGPGKGGLRDYRGQADLFGVYCAQIEKSFLVPVSDVGTTQAVLRVEATRNGQSSKVRMAEVYEI